MPAGDSALTRLDEVMPDWHFRKGPRRVKVEGPSEAVLRAVTEVTWAEMPLFGSLLRIGSFGRLRRDPHRAVLEEFLVGGFRELGRCDREIVLCSVSGSEPFPADQDRAAQVAWFRAYAEPGSTKVAFNFRFDDGVLTTETRVWGTDEAARRKFRRYWTVIRFPAGLVRREILHAARSRIAT